MNTPGSCRNAAAAGPEAGLSLLEVLVAAFLIATVAVSLAPFFVRAVASNVQGGESSLAVNNAKSFTENILGVPFDHALLRIPAGSDFSQFVDQIYVLGPQTADGLDEVAGDESWKTPADYNNQATDGLILWDLSMEVRDYSYHDIGEGVISATTAGTITQGGDKFLFDQPLDGATDDTFRHLKELTAMVETRREGSGIGTGQQLTTRRFRAF